MKKTSDCTSEILPWATAPLELSNTNGSILVRTLKKEDIVPIVQAIHDPEGWSGRMWGIDTPEKIHEMLENQLISHAKGESHPLVYFVNNEVAGITRLHSLFPNRKALELGGTCIAPQWRRTFVNTEVKTLLFTYAFEELNTVRVELRVDCINYVSQLNVLRLGATFEGKIRHWQIRKNGVLPDGMLYSITNKEWPSVKERLNDLKLRKKIDSPFFPLEFETPDLQLFQFQFSEAQEFLELIHRNHHCLVDNFPKTSLVKTIEDAKAYFAERSHWAAAGMAFCYGVRHKNSNQLMAQFQIKNIHWKNRSAEIGYFVDSDYRRKGFASQFINRAMDELFGRNFKRITLKAIVSNEASIQLARKLGFLQEGILRSEFVTGNDEWVDTILFSKTRVT